jgi:hypothetical protein
MLEKIKGTIKYGQFRETGNVGHMTQMLIWLADIQGNLVTMCVELYHAQGVSISRSFTFNRISNENNTTTINQ